MGSEDGSGRGHKPAQLPRVIEARVERCAALDPPAWAEGGECRASSHASIRVAAQTCSRISRASAARVDDMDPQVIE